MAFKSSLAALVHTAAALPVSPWEYHGAQDGTGSWEGTGQGAVCWVVSQVVALKESGVRVGAEGEESSLRVPSSGWSLSPTWVS